MGRSNDDGIGQGPLALSEPFSLNGGESTYKEPVCLYQGCSIIHIDWDHEWPNGCGVQHCHKPVWKKEECVAPKLDEPVAEPKAKRKAWAPSGS